MESFLLMLRGLAAAIIGFMVLAPLPGLPFGKVLFPWAPAAFLAGLAILLSLMLFRFIEWCAGRISVAPLSFSRRMLIPLPVLLCLATGGIAMWHRTTVGAMPDVEFYAYATLISAGALPFNLIEGNYWPVHFVLGVWLGHLIWFGIMYWTVSHLVWWFPSLAGWG